MADLIALQIMVNEREKQIGARLRNFREVLQIPRSKFAVTIGFASERLASYESGRAPLPYEVFRSVCQHYNVSPFWLATGQGGGRVKFPFNDRKFNDSIKPRTLFSEVYDKYLSASLESKKSQVDNLFESVESNLSSMLEVLDDESIPESTRKKLAEKFSPLLPLIRQFQKKASHDLPFDFELEQKLTLTDVSELVNNTRVTPKLPNLLNRLKEATSQRGKKSALAEFLGVSLVQVSQWLSGDREPGGETTLRLLHWVEQQERQK